MPSNCEPDVQEAKENRPEEIDIMTNKLLTDFYEYLVDVDGGYNSVKVAQQYKSQARSVIRTYKRDRAI